MLTFREVTVIDVNSEYLGVQVETLMENAGYAVANLISKEYGKGRRIVVICGMGNNGGDGLVAAKYLRENNDVRVLLARAPQFIKRMAPRKNLGPVEDITKVYDGEDLSSYDLIVDAIYGIGIHGEIKEPYYSLISKMNQSGIPVVSIDVPSGLGTNMAVRPVRTITLHDIKEGMNDSNSGKIDVVDIGVPKDAGRFAGPGEYVYYPIPRPIHTRGERQGAGHRGRSIHRSSFLGRDGRLPHRRQSGPDRNTGTIVPDHFQLFSQFHRARNVWIRIHRQ